MNSTVTLCWGQHFSSRPHEDLAPSFLKHHARSFSLWGFTRAAEAQMPLDLLSCRVLDRLSPSGCGGKVGKGGNA